jgi:hypothetical protein
VRRVVTNCTHSVPLMREFKLLSSPPESGLAARTRKRVSGPEQGGTSRDRSLRCQTEPAQTKQPTCGLAQDRSLTQPQSLGVSSCRTGSHWSPAAARATCRLVRHDLENTRDYGSASAHCLLAVPRNAGSHIARGVPARPTVCMVQVLPQQGPAASRGSLATTCAAGGIWHSPPGRYLGGLFKVWDGASPNFRR